MRSDHKRRLEALERKNPGIEERRAAIERAAEELEKRIDLMLERAQQRTGADSLGLNSAVKVGVTLSPELRRSTNGVLDKVNPALDDDNGKLRRWVETGCYS